MARSPWTFCSGRLFVRFRAPTVVIGIISLLPSILYFSERRPAGSDITTSHAVLNDIIAASLAFTMIDVLKLDGFRTGCVLLTGLFFYDIWWVFGTRVVSLYSLSTISSPHPVEDGRSCKRAGSAYTTNVASVIVARGHPRFLDAWTRRYSHPRSVHGLPPWSQFKCVRCITHFFIITANAGSFIATCLRFDHSRSQRPHEPAKATSFLSFRKPYFNAALIAYIIALNITSLVMQTLDTAQPALLYLR